MKVFTKKVDIIISPKEMGFVLSEADSKEQAAFFDELAKCFLKFEDDECEPAPSEDLQMGYIKEELTDRAKDFIMKLAGYLE